jgi:hypothetical protein
MNFGERFAPRSDATSAPMLNVQKIIASGVQ